MTLKPLFKPIITVSLLALYLNSPVIAHSSTNASLDLPATLSSTVTASTSTGLVYKNTPQQNIKSFSAFSESGKYNIFSINKQPFLLLNAPVFEIIPLKKVSLPQSIVEDIFKTTEKVTGTPLPITSIPTKTESARENVAIENSVVNIFCSQKVAGSETQRKTITGSGVLINKDGTVITNAHVAQFPLIADSSNKVVCLARTGSPAQSTHSIKVAFISPEWIKSNAQYVNTSVAETGQNDYAILQISPTSNSVNLKYLQPAIVQRSLFSSGSSDVFATAYPAEILGIKGVNSALTIQKEKIGVRTYYNFINNTLIESPKSQNNTTSGSNNLDVLETNPTYIGQIGSSGGAIADTHNHLIGLITTIIPNNGQKYSIRAITMDYIDKDISKKFQDGLGYINNYGSNKLKNFFDTNYRSELTSLLLQNLK